MYNLHNKDVIEIGCGNGDFLALLCDFGNNRGVGFDPAFKSEKAIATGLAQSNFTVIQDFYSERYANYTADIICCRHVLEHIALPRDFLALLRRVLGNRLDTVVFFEVPNILFTLHDLGIWDLIYEHCGYFSAVSLAYIFGVSGFTLRAVNETYEGQFLFIDAFPAEEKTSLVEVPSEGVEALASAVVNFSNRYTVKLKEWISKAEEIKIKKEKAVVWGAGSKGVTFLNSLNLRHPIEYVVDVNPHKQGKYIAGSGQKIVSPAFLQEYRPDKIIVMNPIYFDEIRNMTVNLRYPVEYVIA
jgi:SAM-dependent methyltransferase